MTPRVSVGLPFYNAEATLADAIRSVFSQSFTDWSLVLLDDGSTDGSLAIAQAVRDPRVSVHSDGVNRGLIHRLNQLGGMAAGEYMARMDADDLMHPDRLGQQVRYLDEHADVHVVGTAAYSIDDRNVVSGVRGEAPLDASPAAILEQGGLLIHGAAVGRTDWFRGNPYDREYVRAEDFELWLRTSQRSRFTVLEQPLYFCREGRVSLDDYLLTCKTSRQILRTYGPSVIGRRATGKLVLRSHLKSLAYRLFGSLGAHGFLVRRRNRALEELERAEAEQIVQSLLRIPVPGLEIPGQSC